MNWLIFLMSAHAEEIQLNGDAKSFFIAGFPYEHLFMPSSTYGQSFIDGRLKLKTKLHPSIRLVAHHAVTMGSMAPESKLSQELAMLDQDADVEMNSGFMTGVGLSAPEAITLSWKAFEESELMMQGRTDRLYLEFSLQNVEMRVGRQPISFGYGMAFNPMDLIQPFGVATIDNEYKPGVDAIRSDIYTGMYTQFTFVAAYVGDWSQEGMIFAFNGKTTIKETEVSIFGALAREDYVVGGGVSGSIGPIGVYGDLTLTVPKEDEELFVRSEIGTLWKPLEDTTISAEVYVQTCGAEDADQYLSFVEENPRFQSGELWLMGRYYASLGLSQQITPLLGANVSATSNIADQSAMISAGLSYSVADNTVLSLGGFYGFGERPDTISLTDLFLDPDSFQLNSEFGFYPTMFFGQFKAYF
jgi:hypothetical protein